MKKLILTLLLSFTLFSLYAQNMEFNTDGLYNAELFDNIYRGHFENVKMNREDLQFLQIFDQYLRTFGKVCDNYLPDDKVPIMNTECVREEETVTKNGWGVEISRTRHCIEWEKKPSGYYARRDLYTAKEQLELIHDANVLREIVNMMSDQNPIGSSVDNFHKMKALVLDMSKIFQLNSCDSRGIRRFEENLKLFALNKPSIRMEGISKYTTMKISGGPTGSQDFIRLVDDLIADQAQTWMFNRYISESISGVTVLSKDSDGRPAILKANYLYSGFNGKSKGWVKINFTNGLPEGIYFFDFPNKPKTPSSSIVASYAQGDYAK